MTSNMHLHELRAQRARTSVRPMHARPMQATSSHQMNVVAKKRIEADVVIVGAGGLGVHPFFTIPCSTYSMPFTAGIIGLLTAEALLERKLSVALVERKQLFSGATGAGQVCA